MFHIFRKMKADDTTEYTLYNRNTLELAELLYNRLVLGMPLGEAIENLSKRYNSEVASFLKEAYGINSEDELVFFIKKVKIPGSIHHKSHDLVHVIYQMKNMDQIESLDTLTLLIEDIRGEIYV